VIVLNPEVLTEPSEVTLTIWRPIAEDQLRFVRSIDLLALEELPRRETLAGALFLESVILPARLRVLPEHFFRRCPRLTHVGTAGCAVLEVIESEAFQGCLCLRDFAFPSIVRVIGSAFKGTSITCIDLSGTQAKSVDIRDMKFLERLVLPRMCAVECAIGVPALRSVIFGVQGGSFGWSPRQMRFEGFAAPVKGGPLVAGTGAFAEVAYVFGRESFPFPP
jgi:hypothetical protein